MFIWKQWDVYVCPSVAASKTTNSKNNHKRIVFGLPFAVYMLCKKATKSLMCIILD